MYRQKLTKAGQITDTLYVKGLYERVKLPTGVTEHKYNVGNVVVTDRSNDDNDTLYLHKDSKGSTISITDHNGDVVQLFTYDPWGKQSAFSPQPQNGLAAYVSPAVSQGYTGHKMINDIGIIHMGGGFMIQRWVDFCRPIRLFRHLKIVKITIAILMC